MDNLTDAASDAFMEVAIKKMESQDKKLADLEEKLLNGSDYTAQLKHLIASVQELKAIFNEEELPGKIQELSVRLTVTLAILQKPLENKVTHHHHVPKVIWVTAGLFLLFTLVCSGWYMTAEKLDSFIANDTKYRQLKLDTANYRLQQYLYYLDSLYQINPRIREIVTRTEEQNQRNIELLEKARNLDRKAGEMKKKVYDSYKLR